LTSSSSWDAGRHTVGDMFTVFVVDDDPGAARATSKLLRAKGYAVQTFTSSESFLANRGSAVPGCVVVEASLPGLDGLKLQRDLIRLKYHHPVIFLTSNADIPTCVRAMKAGAIDFLIEPTKEERLLAALKAAKKRVFEGRQADANLKSIKARFATLTPRQNEVMTHVIAGNINREIAKLMGTGVKTIKVHRGRVMKKLNVRSVADLVRLAAKAGIS
jgi:FixJ family two-component response regulator